MVCVQLRSLVVLAGYVLRFAHCTKLTLSAMAAPSVFSCVLPLRLFGWTWSLCTATLFFVPTAPAKPSPIPALFPALIGEARAGLRSVFIVLECIWYFSVHSSNFRFADAVSPTRYIGSARACPMHTFSASLQKCASSGAGTSPRP